MEVIEQDGVPDKSGQPGGYSLSERTAEFGMFVAQLVAPKLASHWRDRLKARWADEQQGFADKKPSTQKLYGSKFRSAAKEAVSGAIDFAEGLSADDLATDEGKSRAALTQAIRDMPDERRTLVLDSFRELLASDPYLLADLKRDYRERVAAKHHKLTVVEHWQDLILTFQRMLHSKDPEKMALGILGVTGRRFEEIMSTARFGTVRVKTGTGSVVPRYALTFKGQLKTRGADGTRHNVSYSIPTLAPARDILAARDSMFATEEGRKWQGMSKAQLNSAVNPKINMALRSSEPIIRFWPPDTELRVKDLRALYAEVAYKQFAPSSISKSAFFAQVLGHAANDLTTSLSYMIFALPGDEDRARLERMTTLADRDRQVAERKAAGLPVAEGDDPGDDEQD